MIKNEKILLSPLCRYFILNKRRLKHGAHFKTFYHAKLQGYEMTLARAATVTTKMWQHPVVCHSHIV
jgi:hypothetical protein